MACTSGCRTKDHASYGECLRSKGIRTPEIPVEALTIQARADKTLDQYEAARKQGIQPKSTRQHHVDLAVRASEATGTAYQA